MKSQEKAAMTKKLRSILAEKGLKESEVAGVLEMLRDKPKTINLPRDIAKRICNIILEGERAVVVRSEKSLKWKVFRLAGYTASREATKAHKPWTKTAWHRKKIKAQARKPATQHVFPAKETAHEPAGA